MKVICMIFLMSISMICSSQRLMTPPLEKTLVADETWIVMSGKTSFRVITSNDTIAHRIMKRMENRMTKFTYVQKRDRMGNYWERSFYFKNDEWNYVVLFINNDFI